MLFKTDGPVHALIVGPKLLHNASCNFLSSRTSSAGDTHTILISSLVLSCALLPFLSAPSFPKPPISVLPRPCLLCPFLFQFPSFLSSSSFIFYFIIYYMACNKASVLILKTDDHSSSETKKIHETPPKTHTHFLYISDLAILTFHMLSH